MKYYLPSYLIQLYCTLFEEFPTIASVKKTFKFEMFTRKTPERKKAPLHDSVFKQLLALLVLIFVILVILLALHRCFISNSE